VLQSACQAQYLTRDVSEMRRADYNSTHLVKAVKGLELNPRSFTWVPIDGTNTKIVEANKDVAIKWFASWAAEKIKALGSQPKVLIPIPSSKTIIASPEDFRTFKIAEEIAARVPKATATSLLRFIEPRPSSREEGGSRDPSVLYQNKGAALGSDHLDRRHHDVGRAFHCGIVGAGRSGQDAKARACVRPFSGYTD
jgi:hypothetical protein